MSGKSEFDPFAEVPAGEGKVESAAPAQGQAEAAEGSAAPMDAPSREALAFGRASRRIAKLSETLISQIAAGEVIERPASAVREMLDNAIDSGATKIELSIEGGGLKLIEVSDDGCGIEREDLPLAFERHATSKVRDFGELMDASTMGFRGEAIASLASVARVEITSRREGASHAWTLSAEGGALGGESPASRPKGTSVKARDLFFFVPARRKFLKSESTESGHCRDAFLRAALSRPGVAFTYRKDGKKALSFPAQTPLERAKAVFGEPIASNLAPIKAQGLTMAIEGFAAPVAALAGGKESQFLFVNGRHTRDRLLNHAAKEALLASRGQGKEREVAYVAFLDVRRDLVDVNAHPAKTESRFRDPRAAHQFLKAALEDAFDKLPRDESGAMADPSNPFAAFLRKGEGGAGPSNWESGSWRAAGAESDWDRTKAEGMGQFERAQQAGAGFGGKPSPFGWDEAERHAPSRLRSGWWLLDFPEGTVTAPPEGMARAAQAALWAQLAREGSAFACALIEPAPLGLGAGEQKAVEALAKRLGWLGIELAAGEPGGLAAAVPEGAEMADFAQAAGAWAGRTEDDSLFELALDLALAMPEGFGLAEPGPELWRSWEWARKIPGALVAESRGGSGR